jgi:hypothetical protein
MVLLASLESKLALKFTNRTIDKRPDIVDRCSKRLLSEVVFQTVVVDRVEDAGMTLLPLAACDVIRFAMAVQELSAQFPDPKQRARLDKAFSKLIQLMP